MRGRGGEGGPHAQWPRMRPPQRGQMLAWHRREMSAVALRLDKAHLPATGSCWLASVHDVSEHDEMRGMACCSSLSLSLHVAAGTLESAPQTGRRGQGVWAWLVRAFEEDERRGRAPCTRVRPPCTRPLEPARC